LIHLGIETPKSPLVPPLPSKPPSEQSPKLLEMDEELVEQFKKMDPVIPTKHVFFHIFVLFLSHIYPIFTHDYLFSDHFIVSF